MSNTIKRYSTRSLGIVAAVQRTPENYDYCLKWVGREELEKTKVWDYICKQENGNIYTVKSFHFTRNSYTEIL